MTGRRSNQLNYAPAQGKVEFTISLNGLVRDHEGTSPAPWARWLRGWTAEENRHGDLLNAYLRLTGRVWTCARRGTHHPPPHRQRLQPRSATNPYNLLVYTSFQERATRLSHGNVGRIAGRQGDASLARICGMIAGDEARHEAFYTRMMGRVLDLDPAGGILAFRSMLRGLIAMPGPVHGRRQRSRPVRSLCDRVQRANVYTVRDYASIIEHLVKTWNIAGRMVRGKAAQAQDELCVRRNATAAAGISVSLESQSPMAFSWLRDREV